MSPLRTIIVRDVHQVYIYTDGTWCADFCGYEGDKLKGFDYQSHKDSPQPHPEAKKAFSNSEYTIWLAVSAPCFDKILEIDTYTLCFWVYYDATYDGSEQIRDLPLHYVLESIRIKSKEEMWKIFYKKLDELTQS